MTRKKYRGLPPKKAKAKKPKLANRIIDLENRVDAIERALAPKPTPADASPEPEPAPAEEVKI